MDAIDQLTTDHNTVRDLFDKFRSAQDVGDIEEMRSLTSEIFTELETHTRIEESIFYPAVRQLNDELHASIAESEQEHHVVKVLLREVEALSDETVFIAKMTVLIENVEHHVEEEETDLFPEVRATMDAGVLDDLGRQLQAAR